MGRTNEIRAVLHLPENEDAVRNFENRMADFYAKQVEKKLHSFTKSEKLEVVQGLMEHFG